MLFIFHMKAVGDLALFPVHVLSWYADCFGDVEWKAFQDESGEL